MHALSIAGLLGALLLQTSAPVTLTYKEFESSSPAELARRVAPDDPLSANVVQKDTVPAFAWRTAVHLNSAPRATRFPGLCQIDKRFVGFAIPDRSGLMKVESTSRVTHYRYHDRPIDCTKATPAMDYFSAPSEKEAFEAGRLLSRARTAARRSSTLPFRVKCTNNGRSCSGRSQLAALDFKLIGSVETVACVRPRARACYEIWLTDNQIGWKVLVEGGARPLAVSIEREHMPVI